MIKKEKLAEMNSQELLQELVHSQQMTRLYAMAACLACFAAAVAIIIAVSVIVPKVTAASDAVTALSEPAREAIANLQNLDTDAFNQAAESFRSFLSSIPFFGGN